MAVSAVNVSPGIHSSAGSSVGLLVVSLHPNPVYHKNGNIKIQMAISTKAGLARFLLSHFQGVQLFQVQQIIP